MVKRFSLVPNWFSSQRSVEIQRLREVHQSMGGPAAYCDWMGWLRPEEEMQGQLAREIISFAKAQCLNHASKKQEAAGVVGDCERPDPPKTNLWCQCGNS